MFTDEMNGIYDWVQRADEALDRAKAGGSNQARGQIPAKERQEASNTLLYKGGKHGGGYGLPYLIKLFNLGANLNVQDKRGRTPLMCYLEKYKDSQKVFSTEVRFLIHQTKNPNLQSEMGRTALMLAMENKWDPATVFSLALQRLDPTLTDKAGRSLIDIALDNGYSTVCRLLTSKGVPSKLSDSRALEAFLKSARQSSPEALREHLRQGFHVHLFDGSGQTPLLTAVEHHAIACVSLLLANLADPNLVDDNARSPLAVACLCNDVENARLLLEHEASPNFQDFSGKTPLMLATLNKNKKLIKLLVQMGADVTIRDMHGKRAKDHVRDKNIKRLLRKQSSSRKNSLF